MPSGAHGESANDGGFDWDLPMTSPKDPREYDLTDTDRPEGQIGFAAENAESLGDETPRAINAEAMIAGWVERGVVSEETATEILAFVNSDESK